MRERRESCYRQEKYIKLQKKMPKVLPVPKKVVPLHSLSERHGVRTSEARQQDSAVEAEKKEIFDRLQYKQQGSIEIYKQYVNSKEYFGFSK